MVRINRNTAKIALVDFCGDEEKRFWQKKIFNIYLKWQVIGNIKDYQVLYYEIPWSERDFVSFSLEKQRQMLNRILKNGRKLGCVIGGLPMKWRSILLGSELLEIPSAKELSLQKAIYDLSAEAGGLKGKVIAVLGVEDRFAKAVVDELLSFGSELVLNGKKAKSLAEWYYQNQGLAIPVFRTEKAGEAADAILSLNGTAMKKYEKQTVFCGDLPVKVKGVWQEPFADGGFKCGLAAALAAAGGEILQIYSKRDLKGDNSNKSKTSEFVENSAV